MNPVDLARVLALDAAGTPGPWENGRNGVLMSMSPHGYMKRHELDSDADLIAFYRTAAPAMARTLYELRELAVDALGHAAFGTASSSMKSSADLRNAVLRVTDTPGETEGGET